MGCHNNPAVINFSCTNWSTDNYFMVCISAKPLSTASRSCFFEHLNNPQVFVSLMYIQFMQLLLFFQLQLHGKSKEKGRNENNLAKLNNFFLASLFRINILREKRANGKLEILHFYLAKLFSSISFCVRTHKRHFSGENYGKKLIGRRRNLAFGPQWWPILLLCTHEYMEIHVRRSLAQLIGKNYPENCCQTESNFVVVYFLMKKFN